ncbi:two-component sensor kinase [Renibacterium salmoninarum ATCC 33209]|uniref:Two-component sensor kinase n=1 Tax=Renibacterium salmoninarum (strain ATCC 33209 / DSM 20767 / JCM 11484 / NBRC 15589 / NCIMB 2235) TaxID=288705 RepID=A9WP22_RENSM|nr:two-component sensor kinase [Renibacterium salmoninarum ATCC 33209]
MLVKTSHLSDTVLFGRTPARQAATIQAANQVSDRGRMLCRHLAP